MFKSLKTSFLNDPTSREFIEKLISNTSLAEQGNTPYSYYDSFVALDVFQRALSEKKIIETHHFNGGIENGASRLHDLCLEKGLTPYRVDTSSKGKIVYFEIYQDGTFMSVNGHGNLTLTGTLYSVGPADKRFLEIIKLLQDIEEEPGYIYALVQRKNGFSFERAGHVGKDLIRENYSAVVQDAYDRLVKDLTSSQPRGRLSILKGPPGTGKTYMVRALIENVKKGMFVLIPAEMISQLDGPTFLPTLIEMKESFENGPIILVLEDADDALTKRDATNMSSVRALLNLTDGLLGSSLDLRILCTTNAPRNELDTALTRSGRLTEIIDIGKLNREEAQKVLDKLGYSSFPLLSQNEFSLAEIYAMIGDFGDIKTNRGEKRGMGF